MTNKLPISGNHIYMSPEEIDKWIKNLKIDHDTYLKQYNINFPKSGTAKSLWLVFLKKHQGVLVHKDTISAFVSSVKDQSGKDQQVRHLASDGWYILNKGDKIPNENSEVPSGYHMLVNTESPKPNFLFKALKRAGRVSAKNFDQLKIVYGNRCATCGSPEGKPNLTDPNKITELQKGHMDPQKALTLDNSIPQCQLCNQSYQDDYIFNEKGRVVAVASINPVLRAAQNVQDDIRKKLNEVS